MDSLHPIKVLYLEDDFGLARLLVKNMERAGFSVDIGNNGKIGLGMLAQTHYDIVITDQQMPEMTGLDFIQSLGQSASQPPVIMLTGAGNEQTAVDAMKAGASDYIIKDVDGVYLDLLPTVIRQVIHQQQLDRERKQALEDLQESEERYRTLFNSSHDAILIATTEGQFLDGNPAALLLFGCADGEEFSKLTLDRVSPDHQPDGFLSYTCLREMLEIAVTEGSHFYEWTHTTVKGQNFPAIVSLNLTVLRGKKVIQANIRDMTRQRQTEQTLQKQAIEDSLTGCYNRRHFFTLAARELIRSEMENLGLSLVMFDFDFFKVINDTHGHSTGDIVLVEQTSRIRSNLRPSDIFARVGGEEFVILLPQTTLAQATLIVERIRKTISEPIIAKDQAIISTISFGIACKEGGESINIDKLLDRADKALYTAKNSGRDAIAVWEG